MSAFSDLAAGIDSLATAAGVVIGGVFAYYKFIKDRIYRPRTDLGIEISRIELAGRPFLRCAVSLTNKGAIKIQLRHKGTCLIVRPGTPTGTALRSVRWATNEESAVANVFERHGWVESNETIRDAVLVAAADHDENVPYRVELRVCVTDPSPRRSTGIAINSATIIPAVGTAGPGSAAADAALGHAPMLPDPRASRTGDGPPRRRSSKEIKQ